MRLCSGLSVCIRINTLNISNRPSYTVEMIGITENPLYH